MQHGSGKLAGAHARAPDVFTLLKWNGEWKITHKLFHRHDLQLRDQGSRETKPANLTRLHKRSYVIDIENINKRKHLILQDFRLAFQLPRVFRPLLNKFGRNAVLDGLDV